jgi:starch synthase
VFEAYDSLSLERTLWRALDAHADRDLWSGLVRRAMLQDWSWGSSGREYLRVYERALSRASAADDGT